VKQTMRRAFTLIELMIAITLTALLLTLLYSTANNITKSKEAYLEKEENLLSSVQKIQKLLTLDLLNSDVNSTFITNIETGEPSKVLIHTSNSLHRIENPWVFYKVTEESELLRVESPYRPKFPLIQQYSPNIKVDIICNKTRKFNIYKQKKQLLIIFQCQKNRPTIFRLILP